MEVRIGDVDGDGRGEIVMGHPYIGGLHVFDAVRQAEELSLPNLYVAALRLIDTTGDGVPEIVFADIDFGIHVADGASGDLIETIGTGNGVTDIGYGDSDQDGANELWWGRSQSPGAGLYVYDLAAAAPLASALGSWGAEDFAAGDLEADGDREIVTSLGSSDNGHGAGAVIVRDAATREVERIHGADSPADRRWRGRIALAQLDQDAALEIVESQEGRMVAVDGATFESQWTFPIDSGGFTSLAAGDLDGDGELEIVVVELGSDSRLAIHDGATGAREWRSPALGSNSDYFPMLRLANVDTDPALEIVTFGTGGNLQIWDGDSHVRQLLTSGHSIRALDTADIDRDGVDEIYVASSSLYRVDPQTGGWAESYPIGPWGIFGSLKVLDLDGDALADHLFTLSGSLAIRTGSQGDIVFHTPELFSVHFHFDYDGLRVGDFDGDGRREIWLRRGLVGQMIFEHEDAVPQVSIVLPAAGAESTVGHPVQFAGTALDAEQGDLARSLVWTSSLDGVLGHGASFSTSSLTAGKHFVTATAIDGAEQAGQATVAIVVRTLPQTLVLDSIAAEDGFVLETNENSGIGGEISTAGLRLGDAAGDRQYRAMASFDTSPLPRGALVHGVKLRLRLEKLTNTNPFLTHGSCLVDVKAGAFGGSPALEAADFEAGADALGSGALRSPSSRSAFIEGELDAAGRNLLGSESRLQLRLRFQLDDNDDQLEDYLTLSGGESLSGLRPQLLVTYQQ